MKKIFSLAILTILLSATSSFAYVIDGNVNDWGIDLASAVNGGSGTKPSATYVNGYLDNNLPSGGNDIDYWTEDNADKNSSGWIFVGPGYTHNSNTYDAEAIYFDNDATYAYIAIVTGLSRTEVSYPAGDLFINVGSASDPFNSTAVPSVGSTFAINPLTGNFYELKNTTTLLSTEYFSAGNPWKTRFASATLKYNLGADLKYVDQANSHNVIETKIALADLGLSETDTDNIWLHWTMKCGNDVLNLKADVNAVPEPATIFLFSSSLLGLFGFKRKIFA